MKEGWTYKKLGEVCEILNGFAFQSKNYVQEGIRVIRITNVQKGYVEDSAPKYYPSETQNELSRYLLKDHDLLLSLTGNVGRVAMIDSSYLPAYLNQRVACIRIKKGANLDKSFLFHLLYSKKFEEDCIKSSKGAAQLNMSTIWLASYYLPVPPLSEQRAIVARLDSAFAQIDSLKANAEKQLSEARKLFQKALEEAMTPKEGWEEKTIGEIADVKGGKRVPKGYKLESSDTGYKYIRVSDFTDDGTIDLTNIQYISKEVYEQIKRYTITDEDLYISIAGTIGKSGIIPPDLNGANLTENACKLVFKTNINKRFVYFFTKSDIFMSQVSKATKQASQPKLALTRLAEIVISIPPLSTQHTIVSHLDALSSNVRALEAKLQKMKDECDALKQAMLREVFE